MLLGSLALTLLLAAPPVDVVPDDPAAVANPYPGRLDPGQVSLFMTGRFAQVDVCAARARADTPELVGDVTLFIHVDPDGVVTGAGIRRSAIDNEVLLGCLVATAETWTLPAPSGGAAEVVYTFSFSSTSGPAAAGWHRPQSPLPKGAEYPNPPLLDRPRRPPTLIPGRAARSWGFGLAATGVAFGVVVAFRNDDPLWALPLFGPPLAASRSERDLNAAATAIVLTQAAGAGLLAWGYYRKARWEREGQSAWQRHRMGASLTPQRGGARAGFAMSF